MPRYARETTVPVEKSRAEIEETLRRYGASEFQSGWKQDAAMIAFKRGDLFIRFILPLPRPNDFATKENRRTGRPEKRTENQMYRDCEQQIRQRWRALLLTIKAKLEAVDCGISTIEQEFLAFIVMPNDMSLGEWMVREALPFIKENKMPMLGYTPPAKDVDDAEFTFKP